MASTNRSNNRAGGKTANGSGSKSSAQTGNSKSNSVKGDKEIQEDLVAALKPDWSPQELKAFCAKYNYDSEKINDALEKDFSGAPEDGDLLAIVAWHSTISLFRTIPSHLLFLPDQRPGHQESDWQTVSKNAHKEKKKQVGLHLRYAMFSRLFQDEDKSPVSTGTRGGRGGARGTFTPRGGRGGYAPRGDFQRGGRGGRGGARGGFVAGAG